MSDGISQSQFFMWRTLFAVAHADNIVTDEEIAFMAHVLEDIDFSEEQTAILKDDIGNPKDIEMMFRGITEQEDRSKFFDFARDLVWVDGDFGTEEQSVMIKLFREHFQNTDVEKLVGQVRLEFEDDPFESRGLRIVDADEAGSGSLSGIVSAFGRRFAGMFGKGKN